MNNYQILWHLELLLIQQENVIILGLLIENFLTFIIDLKILFLSPKSNGYRALHTSVIGPKNKKIEIQFRSNVMDQIAEYGVAAHWKYKDPKKIKENDTKEYKWMHDY